MEPFKYCGLDLTGKFDLKLNGDVQKRYLLLITCIKTRAINLEICTDNSVNSFILALKRHIYNYGNPVLCVSDNVSNFTSFNSTLNTMSKSTLVKETF